MLLRGCTFAKPISVLHNDIGRDDKTSITFACGKNSSRQASVLMQGDEITAIPPKDLLCEVAPKPPPAPTPSTGHQELLLVKLVLCLAAFIVVGGLMVLMHRRRTTSASDALLAEFGMYCCTCCRSAAIRASIGSASPDAKGFGVDAPP